MVDPAVVARMNALYDLHREWMRRLDPDAPDSGVPFDPQAWPAEKSVYNTMYPDLEDESAGFTAKADALFAPSQPTNRARFFELVTRNRLYKRDRQGQFSSGDGGGRGIRDAFAGPNTITSLEMAGEAELGGILGRRVAVKLTGLDMDAARAHLEGIARGAELFPHTDLISVTSYGPRGQVSDLPGQIPGKHDGAWGVTASTPGRPGSDIYLNTRVDAQKMRRTMTKAVAEGFVDGDHSDITWTGAHEMGHAAAAMLRRGEAQSAAVKIAVGHAGGDVPTTYTHLRENLSHYSADSPDELIGEATAQVASLGTKASPVARDIVGSMQDHWDEWSI